MLSDNSPQYSRLNDTSRSSEAPQDLDRFLLGVYRYFEMGGYEGVVARAVANLFTVGFTILFSFVLLGLVDWQGIFVRCVDEVSCHGVAVLGGWRWSSLWNLLVLLYLFVFSMYMVIVLLNTRGAIKEAKEIDVFYKVRLGIVSDFALKTMAWSDVVAKLTEAQNEQPFCVVQDTLSPEEIDRIVLREDNFILQFVNLANELNEQPTDDWPLQRLVRLALHSSSCIWNIRLCYTTSFLDDRARLRRDLFLRGEGLGRVFRVIGFLNALLTLPLLLFALFYFFLRDAEDLRASRVSPVQRQWSVEAHWLLRRLNEPPHRLTRRLDKCSPSVEEMLNLCEQQSNAFVFYSKKFVKFVAGSFAAVILLIAVYHEPALFHIHIFNRNLVWYLGVFGALVALTSAPSGARQAPLGSRNGQESAQHLRTVLLAVEEGLGRLPVSSESVFTESGSKGEFFEKLNALADLINRRLYVSRIQVLIHEILGVLATPAIFCLWLPRVAGRLGERIVARTTCSENLGDWPSEDVELVGLGGATTASLLDHPFLNS
jgi:hypothetical protein